MLLLNMLSLIDYGERPVCRQDHLTGRLHQQESGEVRRIGPMVEEWEEGKMAKRKAVRKRR